MRTISPQNLKRWETLCERICRQRKAKWAAKSEFLFTEPINDDAPPWAVDGQGLKNEDLGRAPTPKRTLSSLVNRLGLPEFNPRLPSEAELIQSGIDGKMDGALGLPQRPPSPDAKRVKAEFEWYMVVWGCPFCRILGVSSPWLNGLPKWLSRYYQPTVKKKFQKDLRKTIKKHFLLAKKSKLPNEVHFFSSKVNNFVG